jgi:hypothetical protein
VNRGAAGRGALPPAAALLAAALTAVVLLLPLRSGALTSPTSPTSPTPPTPNPSKAAQSLARIEVVYADWLDAVSAVSTIDSGLTPRVAGRSRRLWAARLKELTARLGPALESAQSTALSAEDARAMQAMRKGFVDYSPQTPDTGVQGTRITCADAARPSRDAAVLQVAMYACFEEIGNRIDFDGRPMVRTTALQQLQQLPDSESRKRLFFALSPLWIAVNAANGADSPYRRMLMLNDADVRKSGHSPIGDAATTLGITPSIVEQWLVQVLEAWHARTGSTTLEPWDYWYVSASAGRELASAIPRDSILATAKRFYRDLGADLDALGVRHDLDVRPGKSPLAYTDQVRIGRRIGKTWRPTLARVSGNYEQGGLFVLNELIHEDGHAVHYSAVHTRPAFFSLGDDVFFEAFADVPAWSSSEPVWQQKYLGLHADEGAALRELYSNVMLDAAWGLFELRMLADPSADPNLVWTDITARYLSITPHPEWSWWALRVQLVRWPGYMINYGLGAVLTADIRQRIRDAIGPFDTGNPLWYGWTSAHLLQFGSSVDTAQLLQQFLGRPVSPDAILSELRRVGSVSVLARQHLGQTLLQ